MLDARRIHKDSRLAKSLYENTLCIVCPAADMAHLRLMSWDAQHKVWLLFVGGALSAKGRRLRFSPEEGLLPQ